MGDIFLVSNRDILCPYIVNDQGPCVAGGAWNESTDRANEDRADLESTPTKMYPLSV